MPKITTEEISDAGMARLQRLVVAHNENSGQNLTLAQWLTFVLKSMMIQEQLAAEVAALQKKHETEGQNALNAEILAKVNELRAQY